MAPSKDSCVLCLHVFFGKQKFFRYIAHHKHVHAKCIVWPNVKLQLPRSGALPFKCNLCKIAKVVARPSQQHQPTHKQEIFPLLTSMSFTSCR